MTVFITGGSGYIGKHVVNYYQDIAEEICILDLEAPNYYLKPETNFSQIDLSDNDSIKTLHQIFLQGSSKSTIIHLAGKKSVSESFALPELYKKSNVTSTKNIVSAMIDTPVEQIVFASTAAVYGDIDYTDPVKENSGCSPISPYAKSKLLAEEVLLKSDHKVALLRFFNVAGSSRNDFIESDGPNLIPASIRRIEQGLPIEIFGSDYPTPDGTCIRDYVHVEDLVDAIFKSVKLLSEKTLGILNIGSSTGYSVIEIINEIELYSSHSVLRNYLNRREGDVARIVADIEKANTILNWHPVRTLREIVLSSIPVALQK